MRHLVDDLMDVSRIAHGKVRIQRVPVDLDPLISQAIEAVQPLLNTHKQHLTVSLPTQPVMLLADPVRLVEVFTNLLNNAAKYTDERGQILLMAAEENDEVVVEFRDTGIGITAEMLPRIFDPFTQATGALNRSKGGIGIGLAMVAHLVRLHGGTVQVFSEGPGHGSRFVVRLPLLLSLDAEDDTARRPDHPTAESGSHCVVEMSDEWLAEGSMSQSLQVVIIKPSKYLADGVVERFRRGFMPNSTVPYMRSMVPVEMRGIPVETHAVDEYVHTDLQYLNLFRRPPGKRSLVALVGVQSHQFHRALDLAAYARWPPTGRPSISSAQYPEPSSMMNSWKRG